MEQKQQGNIAALMGFILGVASGLIFLLGLVGISIGSAIFLIPLFSFAAIICSAGGLIRAKKWNKKDKPLAIIGLILGIIIFIFFLLKASLLL